MKASYLAGCLLVLAIGCGRDAGPATGGSEPSRYLALGDSYTSGQSVPEADSYPFHLARAMKTAGVDTGTPTVIAVTGWTTGELTAGIEQAHLHKSFYLVTLLIGVNNQFRHRGQDEFRTQFAVLVRRAIHFAGDRPKHVIAISIPDWGVMPFAKELNAGFIAHDIDAFNRIAKDESTKAGVRWVDVTPISRNAATQPVLVAEDGLHPSAVQYGRWVDLILPAAIAAAHDASTAR